MGAIWNAIKQGFREGWESNKRPEDRVQQRPRVVVTGVRDDAGYEEERRKFQEQAAQRDREVREGYLLRARALSDAGVDLEQFSEARAIADALMIFDSIVNVDPVGWRNSLARARVNLNPQNLTKAGKVPKNVVVASVDGMPYDGPGVIGYLKYMADGTINMADFHIWNNHVKISPYVRTVDGELRITAIDYYDGKREFQKQLYSDKQPTSIEAGTDVLNHFLAQSAK